MFRRVFHGIEFIFDEETDDSILSLNNVVYELSNVFKKEYIGQVGNEDDEPKPFESRLKQHAKKISINSEERSYVNGLGSSKRIHVRILRRCLNSSETRACEHETILNRRRKIAEARGYKLTDRQLKKEKYSFIYNDILVNVRS